MNRCRLCGGVALLLVTLLALLPIGARAQDDVAYPSSPDVAQLETLQATRGSGTVAEDPLISMVPPVLGVESNPTLWRDPIYRADIALTPALPCSDEKVTVTVTGTWSDGCVPYLVSYQTTGQSITVQTSTIVMDRLPEITFCIQFLSQWEISVVLEPLAAGSYTVWVTGAVQNQAAFTVFPEDFTPINLYLPLLIEFS